ncbi:hypothetical protein MBM_00172 [Drepanopeziza brunnea f. sp. 'multigermtubi' MB_m1]|uniref:Uncharacterized protein n=1 Tax=Marssonina brunnea f. sp. multigermtubi (strain MB_m1) TaxID=1072389 RepID=K1Y7F4_MARBU|nr:uncharacterized protein MBM_00172 [Drepanopeziza brunnea f. sp. 'multigermtubi' MB_m1]EKD21059.1 hypothetical protein MBM_00172 [Drepanopeziza brunnea f. sp. 'multigermtubi' MB_m1]
MAPLNPAAVQWPNFPRKSILPPGRDAESRDPAQSADERDFEDAQSADENGGGAGLEFDDLIGSYSVPYDDLGDNDAYFDVFDSTAMLSHDTLNNGGSLPGGDTNLREGPPFPFVLKNTYHNLDNSNSLSSSNTTLPEGLTLPVILTCPNLPGGIPIFRQFVKPKTYAKRLVKQNEQFNLSADELRTAYVIAVNMAKPYVDLTKLPKRSRLDRLNDADRQAIIDLEIQKVIAQIQTDEILSKDEQIHHVRTMIAESPDNKNIVKWLAREKRLTTPKTILDPEPNVPTVPTLNKEERTRQPCSENFNDPYESRDDALLPAGLSIPSIIISHKKSTELPILRQFVRPETFARWVIRDNQHLTLTTGQIKAIYIHAVNASREYIDLSNLRNRGLEEAEVQAEAELEIQQVVARVHETPLLSKNEQIAQIRAKMATASSVKMLDKLLRQERRLNTPRVSPACKNEKKWSAKEAMAKKSAFSGEPKIRRVRESLVGKETADDPAGSINNFGGVTGSDGSQESAVNMGPTSSINTAKLQEDGNTDPERRRLAEHARGEKQAKKSKFVQDDVDFYGSLGAIADNPLDSDSVAGSDDSQNSRMLPPAGDWYPINYVEADGWLDAYFGPMPAEIRSIKKDRGEFDFLTYTVRYLTAMKKERDGE